MVLIALIRFGPHVALSEERVIMSMFSFVLDASVLNTLTFSRIISKSGESNVDAANMKRIILTKLVSEYAEYNKARLYQCSFLAAPYNNQT